MRRFLFLAVFVLAACREHNSPTEPSDPGLSPLPENVIIAGTIRDFSTDAPLSGVTLIVGGRQLITDAAGRYSLTGPAGFYDASFSGQALGRAIALTSRNDADFRVNGGSCRSRYGAIFDSRTGSPIAGATLAIGLTNVTTGADGAYRFDLGCGTGDHGSGTGFIRIRHPGYNDAEIAYRVEYLAPPLRVDVAMKRK